MNILVSGVAGDIGFGAGRILKKWGIFERIYGIDIKNDHPGNVIFNKCKICPSANSKNYLQWIEKFILDYSIHLFIPTSEAEILFFANSNIKKILDAKILINNFFTVKNSLDKHQTLSYLKNKGIDVPKNGIVGETFPNFFPVIIKPRYGQGSKGVRIVYKEEELQPSLKDFVWQELLLPEDQEFTCPVYKFGKSGIRSLILKRKMMNGMTLSGTVVKNKEIENYIEKISNKMELEGSINIQLRMTKNGPILFEINPRLSGTLVFRDKMGFHDLRWWISDLLNLDNISYKQPEEGVKFFRGYKEYLY